MNTSTRKVIGASAIAWTIGSIGINLVPGAPPDNDASARTIHDYVAAHAGQFRLTTALQVALLPLLIAAVAGLSRLVRDADRERNDGIDRLVLVSGSLAAAIMMVSVGLFGGLAMVSTPASASSDELVQVLYISASVAFAVGIVPLALCVSTFAVGMGRVGAGGRWLSIAGAVVLAVTWIGVPAAMTSLSTLGISNAVLLLPLALLLVSGVVSLRSRTAEHVELRPQTRPAAVVGA